MRYGRTGPNKANKTVRNKVVLNFDLYGRVYFNTRLINLKSKDLPDFSDTEQIYFFWAAYPAIRYIFLGFCCQ